MDRTNAERQKRYRERLKAAAREGGGGALLARLQAAYAEAAQREAARFLENARARGDFEQCDPEQAARGERGLETWVEVFQTAPSEDLIISVVERAGATAGWQLPAETHFKFLSDLKAQDETRLAEAARANSSRRSPRRKTKPQAVT
jgi:hypothetical protein